MVKEEALETRSASSVVQDFWIYTILQTLRCSIPLIKTDLKELKHTVSHTEEKNKVIFDHRSIVISRDLKSPPSSHYRLRIWECKTPETGRERRFTVLSAQAHCCSLTTSANTRKQRLSNSLQTASGVCAKAKHYSSK